MDTFNVTMLFITFAVIAVVFFFLKRQRAQTLLENWAARSGYTIIHSELRRFFQGPFFVHAKGQVIFRVKVRDSNGHERWGWVRCGGWLVGILFDEAAVIWDDSPPSAN